MHIDESLGELLRQSKRVTVLTGAGVSAESGVPTFRNAQTGLWAQYDPHQLATPEAFERDPKLVWDWYAWRRELVARASPNPAHHALARLEKMVAHFTLVTQNVDDLHRRAGSENIIELHGNILRTICSRDRQEVRDWADDGNMPPLCPRCGGLLRPAVVWFGEALPPQALSAALAASQTCEVFLSVGTSSLVEPAASLSFAAVRSGATLVEINPDETPVSRIAHFALRGNAADILPRLCDMI